MPLPIIIPVRGGSVGIPRKALRPIGGVSPLVRTITTAHAFGTPTVVTDDEEIAGLAQTVGAQVVMEHTNPTGMATLDGAVWQGVQGVMTGPVVILQCTSPFLSTQTVGRCLRALESCDTAATVRDDRHVAWTGPVTAPELATPWAVRQQLPSRWVLTGGCIATRRDLMTPERRFGGKLQLVPVEGAEAVDLDAPADWAMAEWYAGAPSSRELLLARVLGEEAQWRGVVVQLSAWSESPEEWSYRSAPAVVEGRILRLRGKHTSHEAQMALDRLFPGEDVVTIVTSAYHQPRAFLTFLRALQRRKLDRSIRLYNAPAPSRMDKLVSEWQKMRTYTADVASEEEGLGYLDWRDREAVPVA